MIRPADCVLCTANRFGCGPNVKFFGTVQHRESKLCNFDALDLVPGCACPIAICIGERVSEVLGACIRMALNDCDAPTDDRVFAFQRLSPFSWLVLCSLTGCRMAARPIREVLIGGRHARAGGSACHPATAQNLYRSHGDKPFVHNQRLHRHGRRENLPGCTHCRRDL